MAAEIETPLTSPQERAIYENLCRDAERWEAHAVTSREKADEVKRIRDSYAEKIGLIRSS